MRISVLLIFSSILVISSGCGNKNSHKDNPTLTAYRLIDDQRTDEAIELLETELAKNPDHVEYKVILASAYAHKSGIKVQKLVPIITQADKLEKLGRKIDDQKKRNDLNGKVQDAAYKASSLLSKFAIILETYDSVPTVSEEQAVYLRYAIYLLNDIGDKISPEDVIYRIVLETILLKHMLNENLIGNAAHLQGTNDGDCRVDLGKANDIIISTGKLLIDISNDIGFTQPKLAQKMKLLGENIGKTISDLTLITTSATALDQASDLFLAQSAIKIGFGKIVICPGN